MQYHYEIALDISVIHCSPDTKSRNLLQSVYLASPVGHKACGAALGLSCGACFEELAGVYASSGDSHADKQCQIL